MQGYKFLGMEKEWNENMQGMEFARNGIWKESKLEGKMQGMKMQGMENARNGKCKEWKRQGMDIDRKRKCLENYEEFSVHFL